MAPFDIKTYYTEQDALMNMPDESVDEIMKRVSSLRRGQGEESSRMSPVHNLIETDNTQPSALSRADCPPAAEAARPPVPAERSEISMNVGLEDSGRAVKRKVSFQMSTMDSSGNKRRKSTDLDNGRDSSGDHPRVSTSTKSVPVPELNPVPISDQEMSPPKSSPEIEEIESFSVNTPKSQGPTKRKALPGKADQIQQKQTSRKHVSAPRASEAAAVTADHSPISSFSRVLSQPPEMSKNPRRDKVIPVLRNPPLNLRPLRVAPSAPSTSKNNKAKPDSIETDGHDSSIEDASVCAASSSKVAKKKRLEAEPSEMLLDIKRRIAEHNSEMKKKRGDKAVKPKSKPAVREPTIAAAAAAQSSDESSIIYVSSSPSSRAGTPGPTGSANTMGKQKATPMGKATKSVVRPMAVKRQTKGKKGKPPPVTPADYARMLQEVVKKENNGNNIVNESENVALKSFLLRRKNAKSQHLTGKYIFYAGGDMQRASDLTRGRMDIVVSLGGNIMAEFDPTVTTQIVAETSPYSLLKAIGLKSLDQIPEHIPTVKWTWVLRAMDLPARLPKDEVDEKLSQYFLYATFVSRFDAGCPRIRSRPRNKKTATGVEALPNDMVEPSPSNPLPKPETDNQAGPSSPVGAPLSPPTSPLRLPGPRGPSNPEDENHLWQAGNSNPDPLAEFYQHAKDQQQAADRWKKTDTSSGESDDDCAYERRLPEKRGFICDKHEPALVGGCPNQDIIDKLDELRLLHEAKLGDNDRWRAFTYSKAIRALKGYPQRIRSFAQARSVTGIGERTAQKIMEILNTGELRRIEYEKTDDVLVSQCFQGIYGVGRSTALQWYNAGCRTLEDVKNRKGGIKLTPAQEVGLKYYDDINCRMPREEAKALFDLITLIAHSLDPKLSMTIMGSYRRGRPDCGDLDIMMTRPTDDGKSHSGILPRLLTKLHDAGIIINDLAIPDNMNGIEGSYRGLGHLPNVQGARMRRVDILCVPWVSRGAAFIYFTGDDIFNRAIRMKAHSMGYSLNQRGLFRNVIRNPTNQRQKLDGGVLMASETEEEIFKILNVPWQEPHERVRG